MVSVVEAKSDILDDKSKQELIGNATYFRSTHDTARERNIRQTAT